MIRIQIFIFFLAIATFLSSNLIAQKADSNRGYISQVGDQAPNLEFSMLDGSTVSLESLKGKVVVLQFTASWCVVCRQEMPHLENEVWLPNKDKNFVLIGVDIDEDPEKVAPFIEKMEITYPVALDGDKSHFYNFATKEAGVTRNIVIDTDGKIAFQTRLFDKIEFEKMKEVITSLLK